MPDGWLIIYAVYVISRTNAKDAMFRHILNLISRRFPMSPESLFMWGIMLYALIIAIGAFWYSYRRVGAIMAHNDRGRAVVKPGMVQNKDKEA